MSDTKQPEVSVVYLCEYRFSSEPRGRWKLYSIGETPEVVIAEFNQDIQPIPFHEEKSGYWRGYRKGPHDSVYARVRPHFFLKAVR